MVIFSGIAGQWPYFMQVRNPASIANLQPTYAIPVLILGAILLRTIRFDQRLSRTMKAEWYSAEAK